MAAIRKAFVTVCKKMENNPRVFSALKHFNSVYSLRLYYMMEIFTVIPESQKEILQRLLSIDISKPLNRHVRGQSQKSD